MTGGSAQIRGYVEFLSRTEVRGWAVDSDDPSRRLEVELLSGGTPLAMGPVDVERADLAALEAGRSDLGFLLRIPGNPVLRVDDLSVRINGTDCTLNFSREAASYEGVVDYFAAGAVGGWAWHVGCPDERVALTVMHLSEPIAHLVADRLRPDLVKAGIGGGRHGFLFDLNGLPERHGIDTENISVIFDVTGGKLHDIRRRRQPERSAAEGVGSDAEQREVAPVYRISNEVLEALRGSIPLDDERDASPF